MTPQPEIPIYAYIKRELKNRIESGDLPEGARVPSELELAREYNVSRNPTRQALRDLEMEGYIVRSPGRGSFVAPIAQRQRLLNVNGWRMLAIACPEIEFYYTRTVVRGFIEYATEKGFQTMVYFPQLIGQSEFDFLSDIRNSGIVEGLAFWIQHPADKTTELLSKFTRSQFPFVLIDRFLKELDTDYVVTDNDDAAYQVTKTLIARGHKDIGIITTELDNSSVEERFSGYRRALADAQIPFAEELCGIFSSMEDELPGPVVDRIMACRRRPTAFFCVNDGIAAKVLDELTDLGYNVPSDVALGLIDDNQFAEAVDIPMLAAAQTGYEMGRISAELLINRINDKSIAFQHCRLKARLNF